MAAEEFWRGIPRRDVAWYPTVAREKCSGCMSCLAKCKRGVYAEEAGKPVVVHPFGCVVGCTGCAGICPEKAITFPAKEYLQKLLGQTDISAKCQCG